MRKNNSRPARPDPVYVKNRIKELYELRRCGRSDTEDLEYRILIEIRRIYEVEKAELRLKKYAPSKMRSKRA